jgi:chlorophyllide a reductase subunit Y
VHEVVYDDAGQVLIDNVPLDNAPSDATPAEPVDTAPTAATDGCHAGAETMLEAAKQAGQSEMLDQFAKDYPGRSARSAAIHVSGLRIFAGGLRMKRTASVLSGSACCVYGLTFTSHFYGARRSVGYVPFNSETLVTGKLFEDIREAVHDMAEA